MFHSMRSGISRATLLLNKQLTELLRKPNEHFSVGLVDDTNLFLWEVLIVGPRNTLYEDGLYKAHLMFPNNYPEMPPKMVFLSEMWHPNINKNGLVCISILHPPRPFNQQRSDLSYELPSEQWSVVQSVETIIMSVISLLSDPNLESPANVDAAVQMRKDYEGYKQKVRMLASKSIE